MADQKTPDECFAEVKDPILAIPERECVVNTMPPDEAMQEARRVSALADKYHDQLIRSDIDPLLLNSISIRAGAFAYSVAAMDSFVKVGENNTERFQTMKKEGYAIRTKIANIYDYIFRNDPVVLATLENIRKGRGDLDMIRDILSYYKLGCNYRERLVKGSVDFSVIEKANTLYNELFNLTAQIDIDPKKIAESKLIYNKAWTYLWRAMVEIYRAGRFVFMDQPEIEELFYSDYRQELGKTRKETDVKAVKTGEPVAAM